jgi:hypothetical protein
MRVLFWTIVVIFFVTYVFAVLGVVLISSPIKERRETAASTPEEEEDLELLTSYVDGIIPLMFTLIQVLTLDSWSGIVRALMKYLSWSWAYFYLYICIAVFVLMNLITAIIVDNAMTMPRQDAEEAVIHREKERRSALRQFQRLFSSIDADGSGALTREEFRAAFENPEIANQLCALDIHVHDCEEIFNLLDTGDGVLSLQEFFEGVTRMEGSATAKDLFRVLKTTQNMARAVRPESGQRVFSLPAASAKGTPGAVGQEVVGAPIDSRPPSPQQGYHLGHVLQRLDEIAKAVNSCNLRVEEYHREVGALAEDLASLRAGDPVKQPSTPPQVETCVITLV